MNPNGESESHAAFPDHRKLEKVQDVLDRNRHLLYQVKANQDAQKPEGLAKNFALLREVNSNLERVQEMYSQLADDYESFMRQHRPESGSVPGSDNAEQPVER